MSRPFNRRILPLIILLAAGLLFAALLKLKPRTQPEKVVVQAWAVQVMVVQKGAWHGGGRTANVCPRQTQGSEFYERKTNLRSLSVRVQI